MSETIGPPSDQTDHRGYHALIIPISRYHYARPCWRLPTALRQRQRQTATRGVASARIILQVVASRAVHRRDAWGIAISCARSFHARRFPPAFRVVVGEIMLDVPALLYHRSSWFRVKRSASLKRHIPSNAAPKSGEFVEREIERERREQGASGMSEGFDRRSPSSLPRGALFLRGAKDEGRTVVGLSKVYSTRRLSSAVIALELPLPVARKYRYSGNIFIRFIRGRDTRAGVITCEIVLPGRESCLLSPSRSRNFWEFASGTDRFYIPRAKTRLSALCGIEIFLSIRVSRKYVWREGMRGILRVLKIGGDGGRAAVVVAGLAFSAEF